MFQKRTFLGGSVSRQDDQAHLGHIAALLCSLISLAPPAQAEDIPLRMQATLGQAIFEKIWVPAPASTKSSDGLGPLYNARACASCHPGGGQGHPDQIALHLTPADPTYGQQLQTEAATGAPPEAQLSVTETPVTLPLPDGSTVTLPRPDWTPNALSHGPLAPPTALSPRLAPPLPGVAALSEISDDTLRALTDPEDENGDGISGRLPDRPHGPGRFGLKSGTTTLHEQSALAFHQDLGLSTTWNPAPWGDCTTAQPDCRDAPHGDTTEAPEVSDQLLDLTVTYIASLPLPQPQTDAPGAALFAAIGCAACHRPDLDGLPAFTDLLLHDMGPDLADPGTDPEAAEWRTVPLWGLGRRTQDPDATFLLHDGRAPSIHDAIVWHGGEASAARDAALALAPDDRSALLTYLKGL